MLSLFFTEILQSKSWVCQSRASFFCGLDNNIFESFHDKTNDLTGRFLYDWMGKGIFFNRHDLRIQYSGGLEGYHQHGTENRMIHHLNIKYAALFGKQAMPGFHCQTRAKKFLNSDRGYFFFNLSPFVNIRLNRIFDTSILFAFSQFNDLSTSFFDYHVNQGALSLIIHFNRSVALNLKWTMNDFNFQRHAYNIQKIDSLKYQWVKKEKYQHDILNDISMYLELYYGFLIRLGLGYQKNQSNSYGYSFDCPSFKLLIVKDIPWNWIISSYGSFQLKNYTDPLNLTLQILPDTENEENSFLIFDLSRELKRNWSLAFRFGWYKNESPFRDRYYKKRLFSLGLTRRFL